MNRAIVLVGFARCGITLVNRYLASDAQLICLSEINSRYVCPTAPNTVRDQLREWYNISIDQDSMLNETESALQYCKAFDKTLLIRDWSFGSFVPLKYNNFQPTYTLNTIDDLETCLDIKVNVFAVVRNPIDVWLSMNNSIKTFHDKELEHYSNFIEDVLKRNIPIFKYEDFCIDMNKTLEEMYKIIDTEMPSSLCLSSKVVGDINYPTTSRGAAENVARPLPRRSFTEDDSCFMNNHTHINEILRKLSYAEHL